MTKATRQVETGALVFSGYRPYVLHTNPVQIIWTTDPTSISRVGEGLIERISMKNEFLIDETHIVILPEEDGGEILGGVHV